MVPNYTLQIIFMDISFDGLKYLVTVVSEDLLKDDFSNLENGSREESNVSELRHDVSEEIYDKIHTLRGLLNELYKYRPLPF